MPWTGGSGQLWPVPEPGTVCGQAAQGPAGPAPPHGPHWSWATWCDSGLRDHDSAIKQKPMRNKTSLF